jgi:hypothetical protein
MLNSLYGKFGFKGEGCTYRVNNEKLEAIKEAAGPNPARRLRNVLTAAYVTAYGRVIMHKYYRFAGAENIAYTDTDSIHSFKRLSFEGEGLGDLKFKGEGYATYVRAKFYLINDLVKCRGLPKIVSAEDVRNMIKHGEVKSFAEKLLRLRLASVRGYPSLTKVYQLTNFTLEADGKRVYAKNINGSMLLEDYTESEPLTLVRV